MDKAALFLFLNIYKLVVPAIAYLRFFIFQANTSDSCCKTQGTNGLTQIILVWTDMDKHQSFGLASCQHEYKLNL